MSQKKLILVICALGYATSTMIMKNIEEFLEKEGIRGVGNRSGRS